MRFQNTIRKRDIFFIDIKLIRSLTDRTHLTIAVDPNNPEDLLTLLALPKTDDDGTDKRYIIDRICHVHGLKAYGSGIASHTWKIRVYLA